MFCVCVCIANFAILLLVVVCASFVVCVPVICPVSVFVTVLPGVGSQLILTLRRKGEVMYWRRGALVGLLVTLCCCVAHCCCAWCWQSADPQFVEKRSLGGPACWVLVQWGEGPWPSVCWLFAALCSVVSLCSLSCVGVACVSSLLIVFVVVLYIVGVTCCCRFGQLIATLWAESCRELQTWIVTWRHALPLVQAALFDALSASPFEYETQYALLLLWHEDPCIFLTNSIIFASS